MPNTRNLVWFGVGVVFAMFVWPWVQSKWVSLKG